MKEHELNERVAQMDLARQGILDDLKRRYKAGDKSVKPNEHWSTPYGEEDRTTTNHFSGAGKLPCPICETGTLSYSRSGSNGHVWARCSTKNCVSWME